MTDTEKAALERRIDELCAEVERLRQQNGQLRLGAKELCRQRDFYYKQDVENGERAQCAINAMNAENAKLRKLAVLQSVIFKHMSTCPTTDCQACPVNEECAESVHLEGVLGIDDKETSWLVQWRSEDAADVRDENAKLRKMNNTMWLIIICASAHTSAEDGLPVIHEDDIDMLRGMRRELGIEVDGC